MEDVCISVSYASVSKDKVPEECLKIGATPMITKSNAFYFQIKVSPFSFDYFLYELKILLNLSCRIISLIINKKNPFGVTLLGQAQAKMITSMEIQRQSIVLIWTMHGAMESPLTKNV